MSSHNLFTQAANGLVQSATSQEILAAARRVLAHRVRRGATLNSPRSVYEYLTMKLGALDYEVFGLVLADQRRKVIECVELFRGTIDGASVHPREIVKLVIEKGAASVVLFHNHPLGGFRIVTFGTHARKMTAFYCDNRANFIARPHGDRFWQCIDDAIYGLENGAQRRSNIDS